MPREGRARRRRAGRGNLVQERPRRDIAPARGHARRQEIQNALVADYNRHGGVALEPPPQDPPAAEQPVVRETASVQIQTEAVISPENRNFFPQHAFQPASTRRGQNTGASAFTPAGHLWQLTNSLALQGISNNTRLAYDSALRSFQEFCDNYNISQSLPIQQQVISLYIAWLYQKGLSCKTASTYLAGLAYFHKINNWHDPTDSFYFKKVMEGFRRQTSCSDTRLPITIDILEGLYTSLSSVCSSWYEIVLFQAIYLVAFFGLFRISELVFTSHSQSERPLLTSDIRVKDINGELSAYLILRKSKNNQCGPPQTISLSTIQNNKLCPVKAIIKYLQLKPSSTYLFCHANGCPVTRYQFSAVLKKCLLFLGFPPGRLLSHSFRIGAATYLDSMGIPHKTIMEKGRWSSNAYMKYIRR